MPARTLVLLALASSAVAFTPPAASSATRSAVRIAADVAVEPTPPPAPKPVPTYNGWAADAKLPCFGLPGAVSPLGFFDPLGFSDGAELDTVKRYREAEVMHGRIAMMAFVGFLVDENTPTITYGFDHPVIGINMLADTAGTVAFAFFLFINLCEAFRANKGWVEPGLGPLFSLRENYYPGDLGFDPLGLKPTAAKEFSSMHTKELSNGRLAMLAVAGIVAQELIDGKSILGHFGI
mmetsp:Transcript_59042/g.111496  ORF Transcript_59042/g.111496 Transcript_59042/m.111496 type:complete len:236 (+) Transcript_59042:65-772(+)